MARMSRKVTIPVPQQGFDFPRRSITQAKPKQGLVPDIGEGCGRKSLSFCLLTPCQLTFNFVLRFQVTQPSGVCCLLQVELTNLCVPKRNSDPRQVWDKYTF
jgi:hypothetical protein